MKTKYLFLVGLVVAFSSCSTAYRTGQTPDDVYYSPAPAQETYVKTSSQDDRESYGYRTDEEQDIRRGIRDQRYRSSSSITFGIGSGYSPYAYNPYVYNPYSYNNPYAFDPYGYKGIYDPNGYNPYNPYNPYYSPYYGGSSYGGYYGGGYYSPVYVLPVIGKVNTNTGARKYNLGAYNSPSVNNNETIRTHNGSRISGVNTTPVRTFKSTKPTNQGTGVGNVIRRVFTPSENRTYTPPRSNNRTYRSSDNDRPAYTPPARTFNNAPSSNNTSTPSSSGSSGSAPVRTFRK